MGEIPCANARIDVNTNRNPMKKQKKIHHSSWNGFVGRYQSNYVDSPTVTQTASDDAHSFNQTSTSGGAFNSGRYFTFNVATYSKSELLSLRKRLSSELDQIRGLQVRVGIVRNSDSQPKSKILSLNKNFGSGIGSIEGYNGLHNESGGINNVMKNAVGYIDLLRECKQVVKKLLRHKCGWIFKSPVDAVALGLYDYHQIVKRPMDLGTVKVNLDKNLYPSPLEFAADVRLAFNNALLYNPKTNPVYGFAEKMLMDFEGFFAPIQRKIDEFCVDQHRGKELQEHLFLSQNRQRRMTGQFQGSSRNDVNQNLVVGVVKNEKSSDSPDVFPCDFKNHGRMARPTEAHSSASRSSNPPATQSDHLPIPGKTTVVASPCLPLKEATIGSVAGTVKRLKSRANDQRKREMSLEEKQNLVIGLQGVPQEKMPYVVHILRKRNEHLAQDGDEIELDIEAMDTETLWELDNLVTNSKMIVSKVESQAVSMDIDPSGIAPTTPVAESATGVMDDENDRVDQILNENEDENVDIDDDMPATSFPRVEIEKDNVNQDEGGDDPDNDGKDASSSSSSSSDSSGSSSDSSSSSSDSDSGGDSDADGVNS